VIALRRATMVRSILLVLAWFALASVAGAQELQRLTPGTRLRVTLISPAQVHVGTFETLRDSTLLLSGTAASRAIPLLNIRQLEASRGPQPGVLGGGIGLALGAVAGGLLGCAANRDSYGVFCGGQNDTKVALGAAIGAAAGAAVGAILFRRERWTTIDFR
jgi:hypothetical protein